MALTEQDMPISIVTPSFNQGDFLQFCLRSVSDERSQGNLEHLVFDGGSTDSSVETLTAYSNSLDYWHSGPDGGQSQAINVGMNRAGGEILSWINSDDGLAPGAAAAMRATLGNINEPAWAIGQCLIIDASNQQRDLWKPTEHDNLDYVLNWRSNYIMQPAVFWNRILWEKAGPLDVSLHYAMDFDLWIRFFEITPPLLVQRPIGIHRVHGHSKTSLVGPEIFAEYLSILNKRLEQDQPRKHLALKNLVSAMCQRANAEVFYQNYHHSLMLLRAASRISLLSATTDIAFWKAAIKLAIRARRSIDRN